MNDGATTDPIEARLRAALIELRPADGAPATLRARVDALPDHAARPTVRGWVRGIISAPSSVAALLTVAAVVLLAVALPPVVDRPAFIGAPNATAGSFDPTVVGTGLLHDPIPTLTIVQVVTIVAALLVAVRFAIRWRAKLEMSRRRDLAAGLGVIMLAAGATALSFQTPFTVTGTVAPILGYDATVDPAPGVDAPVAYYSTAAPGGPTIAMFQLFNFGPVPVRLDGLVADYDPEFIGPQLVALAEPADENALSNQLDQLRPFAPTVIEPNGYVTVFLVGKAGSCAYGPAFRPGVADSTGYSSRERSLRLGYSIVGLSSTTTVEMPMLLVEPAAAHCP